MKVTNKIVKDQPPIPRQTWDSFQGKPGNHGYPITINKNNLKNLSKVRCCQKIITEGVRCPSHRQDMPRLKRKSRPVASSRRKSLQRHARSIDNFPNKTWEVQMPCTSMHYEVQDIWVYGVGPRRFSFDVPNQSEIHGLCCHLNHLSYVFLPCHS